MEGIRQYILSVTAAAILCSALREMFPSGGSTASLLKLVSGMVLAFVIISPVKNITIQPITEFFDSISTQSDAYISEGQNLSTEAMDAIITERTEAYILDKAAACGAAVTVEIRLDRNSVPESAVITGSVSPYVKALLADMMERELGIAKEQQTWIGQQ